MVSVERCIEYTELASEAVHVAERRPAATWPLEGSIQVSNLSVRYAPQLPLVLNNITLSI